MNPAQKLDIDKQYLRKDNKEGSNKKYDPNKKSMNLIDKLRTGLKTAFSAPLRATIFLFGILLIMNYFNLLNGFFQAIKLLPPKLDLSAIVIAVVLMLSAMYLRD